MQIMAGIHKGRKLIVPHAHTLRPTFSRLKKTLFDCLQSTIEGASFLDLFAGCGGIGIEALSRGASHVTFVEREPQAARAIKENLALVKEEKHALILVSDVFEVLKRLAKEGRKFDIIFADPPYGTKERSLSNQVLQFVDTYSLLNEEGRLFLEDDAGACDLSLSLQNLTLKKARPISRALLREYSHFKLNRL